MKSDWIMDDVGAAGYLRTWIDRRLFELNAQDYDKAYMQLQRHPWRLTLFDLTSVPAEVTECIQIDFEAARQALRERPVNVLAAAEALARALSRVTSESRLPHRQLSDSRGEGRAVVKPQQVAAGSRDRNPGRGSETRA